MKTYTVCFGPLAGLKNTDGVMITPGIAATRSKRPGDPMQINLGEFGPGARWTNVQFSLTMPPRVEEGNLVMHAGVFRPSKNCRPILDKPPVGDDHAILVRINTKTQLKFELCFTAVGHGTRIVAEGSSYDTVADVSADDMLVTIEPHQAVIVGQPENKELFAVVNNAGVADVVTVENYQMFFAPHVLATEDTVQQSDTVTALPSDPARIDVLAD